MPRLLLSGDASKEARRIRDAGHEVVALGAHGSAEQVAAVAVQEDVAAVAVTDPELGAAVAAALDRSGDFETVVFWITSDLRPSSASEDRD